MKSMSMFRKKYSTWDPGVSRPSGMILVACLVMGSPLYPVAGPAQPGTLEQVMLVLVAEPLGSMRKQRERGIPRMPYLASSSWYVAIQFAPHPKYEGVSKTSG